jgi:Uma2 family endonuclease
VASAVHIPVEQYLQTSYRPDREYIDGEVRERNVGTWQHARLMALLSGWIGAHEQSWKCMGAIALRIPVSSTRVRVPDLAVFSAAPVPAAIPLLVIEILSPEDTYSDTQERTADYRNMGIEAVWIIDPKTRSGRMSIGTVWIAAVRLEVPGTLVYADLPSLFARLERPNA